MAAMTNLERLERFYTEQGGKVSAAPSIAAGKNFAFLQTLPASKTSAYNFHQPSLLESSKTNFYWRHVLYWRHVHTRSVYR